MSAPRVTTHQVYLAGRWWGWRRLLRPACWFAGHEVVEMGGMLFCWRCGGKVRDGR